MREIKFKAWDSKKMCDVIKLDFDNKIAITDITIGQRNQTSHEYVKFDKIMQYTGIKDKNNKEIYEGDIVLDEETKGIIRFEQGRFIICSNEYMDSYVNIFDIEICNDNIVNVKIIGNIYENPELLKEDK